MNILPSAMGANAPSKSRLTIYLADVIHGIRGALGGKLSLSELSRRLGLPFDLSSGEVEEISLSTFMAIMSELSRIHHDESCNVSERPKISGSTQFMLDQVSGCKTLKEALVKLVEVGNYLNGALYNKINETSEKLQILVDDEKFPYKSSDDKFLFCYVECLLIKFHCVVQYLVGMPEDFDLPHVSMKRSPCQHAYHLGFWQGRIRYQAKNYIMSYDANIGDIPLQIPARGVLVEDLYEYAHRMISATEMVNTPLTLSGRVKNLVLDGMKSQTEVSKELGMSVTTMRRRLLDEGTTFRNERKTVQRELAATMLEAGLSADDITDKLGFSDLRSFSRAFKEWYGTTPIQYQKSRRHLH